MFMLNAKLLIPSAAPLLVSSWPGPSVLLPVRMLALFLLAFRHWSVLLLPKSSILMVLLIFMLMLSMIVLSMFVIPASLTFLVVSTVTFLLLRTPLLLFLTVRSLTLSLLRLVTSILMSSLRLNSKRRLLLASSFSLVLNLVRLFRIILSTSWTTRSLRLTRLLISLIWRDNCLMLKPFPTLGLSLLTSLTCSPCLLSVDISGSGLLSLTVVRLPCFVPLMHPTDVLGLLVKRSTSLFTLILSSCLWMSFQILLVFLLPHLTRCVMVHISTLPKVVFPVLFLLQLSLFVVMLTHKSFGLPNSMLCFLLGLESFAWILLAHFLSLYMSSLLSFSCLTLWYQKLSWIPLLSDNWSKMFKMNDIS